MQVSTLGTTTADGTGHWSLTGITVNTGDIAVATSTDGNDNTSELSNCNLVATTNDTICAGDSTSLTAKGPIPLGDNYVWSPNTGLSSTTGANVKASPATTTTYTVQGSGGGSTASVFITVNASPNVSISGTQAICDGVKPYS